MNWANTFTQNLKAKQAYKGTGPIFINGLLINQYNINLLDISIGKVNFYKPLGIFKFFIWAKGFWVRFGDEVQLEMCILHVFCISKY